jgi:hypothetical protein
LDSSCVRDDQPSGFIKCWKDLEFSCTPGSPSRTAQLHGVWLIGQSVSQSFLSAISTVHIGKNSKYISSHFSVFLTRSLGYEAVTGQLAVTFSSARCK